MGRFILGSSAGPLAVLTSLLVFGCTSLSSEYPPPDPLPAQYTVCEVSSDCQVVEFGCCPCTGHVRAVAKSQVYAALDRYMEVCEEDSCTHVGCCSWEATCDDGVCGKKQIEPCGAT